jgi:hypothetical protein
VDALSKTRTEAVLREAEVVIALVVVVMMVVVAVVVVVVITHAPSSSPPKLSAHGVIVSPLPAYDLHVALHLFLCNHNSLLLPSSTFFFCFPYFSHP